MSALEVWPLALAAGTVVLMFLIPSLVLAYFERKGPPC